MLLLLTCEPIRLRQVVIREQGPSKLVGIEDTGTKSGYNGTLRAKSTHIRCMEGVASSAIAIT